jgi:hypothetical protein
MEIIVYLKKKYVKIFKRCTNYFYELYVKLFINFRQKMQIFANRIAGGGQPQWRAALGPVSLVANIHSK